VGDHAPVSALMKNGNFDLDVNKTEMAIVPSSSAASKQFQTNKEKHLIDFDLFMRLVVGWVFFICLE